MSSCEETIGSNEPKVTSHTPCQWRPRGDSEVCMTCGFTKDHGDEADCLLDKYTATGRAEHARAQAALRGAGIMEQFVVGAVAVCCVLAVILACVGVYEGVKFIGSCQ